jgi:hypothetical protein
MGGGSGTESESKVRIPKEVRDALTRMSGKSEDLFDLKSDFFKDVMMPYQKDLMKINNELLPFISDNMKQQLQIQSADMLGESELRDQLRGEAGKDIERSGQLGDQLFAKLQEKMDIDLSTQKKRTQISQEFGRLEKNLVREGLDPTSPESRALKKELEMEQAKASVQARTSAENEAFQALVGGTQAFQSRAMQNTARSAQGSMAGGNAPGQQFGVSMDDGSGNISQAMSAQNILSKETTTSSSTQQNQGFGSIAMGALSGGLGSLTGGLGGSIANIGMGMEKFTGGGSGQGITVPRVG